MAKRVVRKRCRDCQRTRLIKFFVIKERRKFATRYVSRCRPCWSRFLNRPGPRKPRTIGLRKVLTPRQARLRQLAWWAINQAVYKRRIVKPSRCSRCRRRVFRGRLQGHHEDYRKKLDVKWLCERCHQKEERRDV